MNNSKIKTEPEIVLNFEKRYYQNGAKNIEKFSPDVYFLSFYKKPARLFKKFASSNLF